MLRASEPPKVESVSDVRTVIAEFRAGRFSPLQTAQILDSAFDWLGRSRWVADRWPPFITRAAKEAYEQFYLGIDVELWHSDVREQKRAQLKTAEERWRGPVEEACRDLLTLFDETKASARRQASYLLLGVVAILAVITLLRGTY